MTSMSFDEIRPSGKQTDHQGMVVTIPDCKPRRRRRLRERRTLPEFYPPRQKKIKLQTSAPIRVSDHLSSHNVFFTATPMVSLPWPRLDSQALVRAVKKKKRSRIPIRSYLSRPPGERRPKMRGSLKLHHPAAKITRCSVTQKTFPKQN